MDWNGIVKLHGRMVYLTAWRILGHEADTEDVVQEVLLEAIRLQSREPIRHWGGLLRRLATCRALDRLRRRRPQFPLEESHLMAIGDNPEEIALGTELEHRLRDSLSLLPEREAGVFCLRYFDDLSNQEIAKVLRISIGAVGAALHKARAKLEVMLGDRVAR